MYSNYPNEETKMAPEYDGKVVVNSLPCAIKQPVLLFWGAIFCLVVSLCISLSAVFDIFSDFNYLLFHRTYSIVSLFSHQIVASQIFGFLASGCIVALLYFFAEGTKALNSNVYSAANTLMVLYIVNLGLSLVSFFSGFSVLYYIIGFCSLIVNIIVFIFYFILGSRLRNGYEGEVANVGKNLIRMFYFILIAIFAVILSVILLVSSKAGAIVGQNKELATIAMILMVLSVLWSIFLFFYLYFGVYYKMAGVLQNNNR